MNNPFNSLNPHAKIKLNSIEDVKEFNNIVTYLDYDVILAKNNYMIDAKSILGIFTLNLCDTINVFLNDKTKIDEFKRLTNKFVVT